MTLCWSLDKLGPMARSVEDTFLVLAALTGPDPGDRVERAEQARLRLPTWNQGHEVGFFPRWMTEAPATEVESRPRSRP